MVSRNLAPIRSRRCGNRDAGFGLNGCSPGVVPTGTDTRVPTGTETGVSIRMDSRGRYRGSSGNAGERLI